MKPSEKYTLEIESIMQKIDDLKNGRVYELDPVPGTPKCETLGSKLEQELKLLIAKLDADAAGNIEIVAEHIER